MGKRKLTVAQQRAIVREYAAGLEPVIDIARRYGVTPQYPTMLAARMGVPRRIPWKNYEPNYAVRPRSRLREGRR